MRLRNQSWLRTLWHLLLMSFLVGMGIAFGEHFRLAPEIKAAGKTISEQFGGIRFSPEGIVPQIGSDRPAETELPYFGRLYYSPDGNAAMVGASAEFATLKHFFFWSPKCLLIAVRSAEGVWQLNYQLPSGNRMKQLSSAELLAFLERMRESKESWAFPDSTELSGPVLTAAILNILWWGLWLGGVLMVLAFALLFTGLFCLSFRLFGMRRLQVLDGSSLWIIGLYAGFPAMLIAGCFPALDLPFFGYSTVFMFGLMIYWLMAINHVERSVLPDASDGRDL